MTVALLQAGAAQNTGVSSPSSQSSVNYAPGRAGPQYFSPSSFLLQKLYSRQEWLRGLGCSLPPPGPHSSWCARPRKLVPNCLVSACLQVGQFLCLKRQAQKSEKLIALYHIPLVKRESHFQRSGLLSFTALEQ